MNRDNVYYIPNFYKEEKGIVKTIVITAKIN